MFYFTVTLLKGQDQRSGVKVKGQGQGHGSLSKVQVKFWHVAVDIRGSALPSAAKSNESHYQSKVCVYNQWAYADNCADAVVWLLIIMSN